MDTPQKANITIIPTVKAILVTAGAQIDAKDLLIELEV